MKAVILVMSSTSRLSLIDAMIEDTRQGQRFYRPAGAGILKKWFSCTV
jgi:hypothetical protein